MIIFLTRHGETVGNVDRKIQGHLQGELTAQGIEQARKLAERLSSEKIDAIYSSSLKRAMDTAQEIAKFHKHVPLVFADTLRERNFGTFEGKSIAGADWHKLDNETNLSEFGAESVIDMFARAERAINELFDKHKDDTVLIVGHGSMGRAIIGNLTGRDHKEYNDIERLHNTSVSVFELDTNGKSRTLVFNCVKHLS